MLQSQVLLAPAGTSLLALGRGCSLRGPFLGGGHVPSLEAGLGVSGGDSGYVSMVLRVTVPLFQVDGSTTTLNWTVMISVCLQVSILGN